MLKRLTSLVLCLVLVASLVPAVVLTTEDILTVDAASENLVTLPDNDGLTNNTSYILGEGTDAEVEVICDFRAASTAPTATITPKYVTIHNTGTYVSTANAKNTHNNTNKVSGDMAWHYTTDNVSIYQGLQDTRKGWHIGSVANNPNPTNTNSNSIGIEMCVHNFPATETFDGEQWSDGTAILQWWENQFDQTMKNTAYLALVLCKRWGLDWRTRIVTHYDALNYYPGGKDCPMQMRATYDPETNTFQEAGSYVDGRDGYFWQMFWSYLEAYASGATSATDSTLTSAAKLGTYVVTASEGLNVRAGIGTSYEKVGGIEYGTPVKVTELNGTWGKVVLADGTEGWCNIVTYGDYIGVDALAYTNGVNSDGMHYAYDTDGGLVLTNNSAEQGQFDLFTPHDIGTLTTPYMSLQITPLSGNGYYFGITQYGSGYFMMRDKDSSSQLVEATTAPYMLNQETLEINLSEWWKPTDGQRVNQVRIYLAPNSSVKLNYFYFAAASGTVIDPRYNLMATSNNIHLMQPDTIAIGDPSKKGSYIYNNGMLTVTADTDAGFDVVFNVNETFDINSFKRFLIAIEANTKFNITLTVTHADGVGEVSLVNDFYPNFVETYPTDGYIPGPWEGSAGLDLYNYYNYNGIIPADGMSTLSKVTVSLGSAGTSYFSAIQLAENDRILSFLDGVYKEGSSDGNTTDTIVLKSDIYTLRTDNIISGVVPSTVSGFVANLTSDYTVTVYENDTAVTGDAVIKTGQTLKVTDGDTVLVSYQIAVANDVNGDGTVSTLDARAILKALAGTALTNEYSVAADYDGNGEVSTADARNILKSLAA